MKVCKNFNNRKTTSINSNRVQGEFKGSLTVTWNSRTAFVKIFSSTILYFSENVKRIETIIVRGNFSVGVRGKPRVFSRLIHSRTILVRVRVYQPLQLRKKETGTFVAEGRDWEAINRINVVIKNMQTEVAKLFATYGESTYNSSLWRWDSTIFMILVCDLARYLDDDSVERD